MHYELYIDLFFLINFLMDYFLLLMVGKMLKCRIRRLRIIAGAMVGAFLTCIFVVFLRGKIWRLVLFHGVMNMCLLKTGLGIKEKRTLIKAEPGCIKTEENVRFMPLLTLETGCGIR